MNVLTALLPFLKLYLEKQVLKEARKYLDRVVYLEKQYLKEENKDEADRNHAYMDNIVSELCIIAKASTNIKK